jgi:hypothetical protein
MIPLGVDSLFLAYDFYCEDFNYPRKIVFVDGPEVELIILLLLMSERPGLECVDAHLPLDVLEDVLEVLPFDDGFLYYVPYRVCPRFALKTERVVYVAQ